MRKEKGSVFMVRDVKRSGKNSIMMVFIVIATPVLNLVSTMDCDQQTVGNALRPLAAGEKTQIYQINRLLKGELNSAPWILISKPRRDDQCARFVYRCGNRIIHVPMTSRAQSSAAIALKNLGKRLAPTTEVDGMTLPADVVKTIRPKVPKRFMRNVAEMWQPPRVIYVQNFVDPLTGLEKEAMKEGKRWVEDGLIANLSKIGDAGIARAKRLIDDYFEAIEDMWEAGIFNLDAVLINAGADIEDKVRFFDLGVYTEMSTREAAVSLANAHIAEIVRIDEEEDIQDSIWEIQQYFISQASKRLTIDNMMRCWETGFYNGFSLRRKADDVAIELLLPPPMVVIETLSKEAIPHLEASI